MTGGSKNWKNSMLNQERSIKTKNKLTIECTLLYNSSFMWLHNHQRVKIVFLLLISLTTWNPSYCDESSILWVCFLINIYNRDTERERLKMSNPIQTMSLNEYIKITLDLVV